MRTWIIAAAVAVVVGGLALLGAPRAPRLSDTTTGDRALAAEVRRAVDDPKGYRGLAVAVVEPGRVRVAGLGDRGDGRPVNGGTAFEIGSVGKAFTGMLLADLAQAGTVRPDEQLRSAWPAIDGRVGDVTLAELSSHRSGLPRLPLVNVGNGLKLYWANLSAGDPYSGQDADWIADVARDRRPGDGRGEVHYSNFGAAVLGQALAARTGTTYPELVDRRLLRPLGMTSTRYALDGAAPPDGHAVGSTAAGRAAAPWTGSGWAPAGVGAWSTADDLGKFVSGVLAGSAPGTDATTPRFRRDADTRIGYGWFTTKHGDREIVWHNGGTAGFRAYVGIDKAAGRGVVVLGNTDRDVDPLGRRLLGVSGPDDGIDRQGWIGVGLGLASSLLGGLTLLGALRDGTDRLRLVSTAGWAVISLLVAYRLGNWLLLPSAVWAIGAVLTLAGLALAVRRWRDLPLSTGAPQWLRWSGAVVSAVFATLAVVALV